MYLIGCGMVTVVIIKSIGSNMPIDKGGNNTTNMDIILNFSYFAVLYVIGFYQLRKYITAIICSKSNMKNKLIDNIPIIIYIIVQKSQILISVQIILNH